MAASLPFYHDSHALARDLRDVLIEHLDGTAVDLKTVDSRSRRRRAFRILLDQKMLVLDPVTELTAITETGRERLAYLLGDYADAMLRVALAVDSLRPSPMPVLHLGRDREKADETAVSEA